MSDITTDYSIDHTKRKQSGLAGVEDVSEALRTIGAMRLARSMLILVPLHDLPRRLVDKIVLLVFFLNRVPKGVDQGAF